LNRNHDPFSKPEDAPFIVEVPAGQLKPGAENVLYVRVHNQAGAGGIWRPVFALETVPASNP
jgi:hypothetical protein